MTTSSPTKVEVLQSAILDWLQDSPETAFASYSEILDGVNTTTVCDMGTFAAMLCLMQLRGQIKIQKDESGGITVSVPEIAA